MSEDGSKVHVVIARFNENIDHLKWLEKFPHTIYNRGDNVPSYFHSLECLENVGRESFLYLSYIAKHYHHLSSITIFSQPSQAVKHIYNDGDFKSDVEDLASGKKTFSVENDGFAFCIPGCTSAVNEFQITDLGKKYGTEKAKLLRDGYKERLHFPVDNPRYSGTGCFFVTREAIHRNSRQYYVNLARSMQSEQDPIEGHFLERAWAEVFHSNCSAGVKFHCLLDSHITC